jgi:hypothetical protein
MDFWRIHCLIKLKYEEMLDPESFMERFFDVSGNREERTGHTYPHDNNSAKALHLCSIKRLHDTRYLLLSFCRMNLLFDHETKHGKS